MTECRKSCRPLILAENGTSDYRIVYSARATAAEKNAASELARYLTEISGATLPVTHDGDAPHAKEILIGQTSRHPLPEAELRSLGEDGFVIRTVGETLCLGGATPRAALYAVYEFLEKYLGCRFYTDEFEVIPKQNSVTVDPIAQDRQVPTFSYRNVFWYDYFREKISVKRKVNGAPGRTISDEWGGAVTYAGYFVHTFNLLLPPDEYAAEHPEYYSLQEDGTRQPKQLCLSNPDVLRIVTQNVRQWLTNHPDARIISVSQNDAGGPCLCENCRRIYEEEGAYSGSLLRFVNAVADDIREDFPHVMVDTLAYTYTRSIPKKTRAAKNVVVRLCSIECCFSHPLESCTVQPVRSFGQKWGTTTFQEDLRNWSQVSDSLYIWDYTTDFHTYNMTFPNFRVLRPNVRLFAENHVIGVFEQGAYQSPSGEFQELRAYLLSRLLWDPYMSEETYQAYMNEFLRDYYGAGWENVRAWIDRIEDAVADYHLGIYDDENKLFPPRETEEPDRALPSSLTAEMFADPENTDWTAYAFYYHDASENELLTEGEKLFFAAEAAAETETHRAHIRKSALQFRCARSMFLAYRNSLAKENLEKLGRAFFAAHPDAASGEEAEAQLQRVTETAGRQLRESYIAYNAALRDDYLANGIFIVREGRKSLQTPDPDLSCIPGYWYS